MAKLVIRYFCFYVFILMILNPLSSHAVVAIGLMTKKCGTPPTFTNATVAAGNFGRGSQRTVSCNSGYGGSSTTITCQANGWQGSSPSCSSSISCPTGYVLVPKNSNYTTADFCVAKYEASKSGSKGVSVVAGTVPWVNITQTAAVTACAANGTGYALITNAEWQTIAQNIELVAANWSGGTIGSAGGLSRGHSNSSPLRALNSHYNDAQGCIETGITCSNTIWSDQRRTLTLSNGKVIWDFAGNVCEWINDTTSTNFGADSYLSLVTAANHTATGTVGGKTGNALTLFGPSGNYTALSSPPCGGLGYGQFTFSGGVEFTRGGDWADGGSGAFAVLRTDVPSYTGTWIGFRCVFHP